MVWRYDAGQPWDRRKHGWGKPEAGFLELGDHVIGKCPAGIPQDLAETLLNSSAALPLRLPRSPQPGEVPDRIFVFHEGVLYRCMPTLAGISYHAFPEAAVAFDKHPSAVKKAVWEWAATHGFEDGVRQWLSNQR